MLADKQLVKGVICDFKFVLVFGVLQAVCA